MLAIKIWYHIEAMLQLVLYKIMYGNRLKIGKNVTWRRHFSLMIGKTGSVEIGDNCFFNNDCSIASYGSIKIGEGTIFGENVKIYDHNHKFKGAEPIKDQGFSIGEVLVGSHCWVGSNAVLLKKTNIADFCVVGAGCVISGAIPQGTLIKREGDTIIEAIRR